VELVVVGTGVVELVVVGTGVVVDVMHSDDPGEDVVPATQGAHVDAPGPEYVPPLHAVHTLGPILVEHLLAKKAGVSSVSSEHARQLTGF
jgi:hypothetical protein